MKTIKIGRPLIELINLCYLSDRPLLLTGPHGVGKSEILEAAAKELGIDYICRDLSLMEPPDLIGLPKLDGGVTRFLPPSFLPTKGKGLIVFEELNRCPNYMRAPCLQLLTARSLNDYALPPGWLPVAAINPSGEEYEVCDLDPALLSRFVQATVEADLEEWLHWARTHNVHPSVIDYVGANTDIFSGSLSNPRSWKYVSDVLHGHAKAKSAPETLRIAIAGLVGDKRAAAFFAFAKTRVLPLRAEEILSSYDRYRAQLQAWIRDGRLDLLRGSLFAIKICLQAQQNYVDVKNSRIRWRRLGEFLSDLPGDLREEAESFFQERNYSLPTAKRK